MSVSSARPACGLYVDDELGTRQPESTVSGHVDECLPQSSIGARLRPCRTRARVRWCSPAEPLPIAPSTRRACRRAESSATTWGPPGASADLACQTAPSRVWRRRAERSQPVEPDGCRQHYPGARPQREVAQADFARQYTLYSAGGTSSEPASSRSARPRPAAHPPRQHPDAHQQQARTPSPSMRARSTK